MPILLSIETASLRCMDRMFHLQGLPSIVCFKLSNIDKDKLATFEKASYYNDVLKVLCVLGTELVWHKDERKCLKTKTTSTSNNAWSYFLNAPLMPISHDSNITLDYVVLRYAIIKGLSIDVGRVIRYSIFMPFTR
ncbi:hypothetical protein PanWU01x14_284040 [Parasponia andersonii]|uniref:Putative plant transposon protein domain-containing protein n=1 Tax=Parasponia andersonii TaxID=3476 RepID=A0A2P5B059_PARAD|nr:hypothetical protein PanWU01x14_284040 [Parasponia andersonii]